MIPAHRFMDFTEYMFRGLLEDPEMFYACLDADDIPFKGFGDLPLNEKHRAFLHKFFNFNFGWLLFEEVQYPDNPYYLWVVEKMYYYHNRLLAYERLGKNDYSAVLAAFCKELPELRKELMAIPAFKMPS